MNVRAPLALLLAAGSWVVAPAVTAQGAPSAAVAQAIADVEAKIERGLAARDRAALEPLLSPAFVWVHGSDGRIDSREIWLAAAAQGMALSGQRQARTEHGAVLVAHGSPEHTVVRLARVRLLDSVSGRESWARQMRLYVPGSDGAWRLAWGQAVVMYEGKPLDAALHARYAGTYVIGPGRALTLAWEDGALLATFPNGSQTQIFLASPTDEAVRTMGSAHLRFTLGPDARPIAAALVRDEKEIWRAPRSEK